VICGSWRDCSADRSTLLPTFVTSKMLAVDSRDNAAATPMSPVRPEPINRHLCRDYQAMAGFL
jgi:hypothetical protein